MAQLNFVKLGVIGSAQGTDVCLVLSAGPDVNVDVREIKDNWVALLRFPVRARCESEEKRGIDKMF